MKRGRGASRSLDEYIAGFPPEVQEAAPDAEEAIRYGIPTFVLKGNLVHFAAFKEPIGFYPTPSAIGKFERELSRYPRAKGSVRFPIDQPMPSSLVRRMVAFRVEEVVGIAGSGR